MAEIRCVFRAHYKSGNMGFYDLAEFDVWLPESEAIKLMNNPAARERLFRMHYPSAEQIAGNVSVELHERR